MNAWVEDRYYWNHTGLRFRPGLRGSIGIGAGIMMMLGITLSDPVSATDRRMYSTGRQVPRIPLRTIVGHPYNCRRCSLEELAACRVR